jgi:translocation and assembly module TamB
VQVRGLTRSGLVLTSRPMNLSLVADLDPSALQARAVFKDGGRDGGTVRGGVQALLSGLPRGGTVLERCAAAACRRRSAMADRPKRSGASRQWTSWT